MSLGKGGNAGRVAGGEAVVLLALPVVALILRPVSLPLLRRRQRAPPHRRPPLLVVFGTWRCHNRLSLEDSTGVAKCLAAALDAASEAGVGEEIFVSIEEELASREVLPPEERPGTSYS